MAKTYSVAGAFLPLQIAQILMQVPGHLKIPREISISEGWQVAKPDQRTIASGIAELESLGFGTAATQYIVECYNLCGLAVIHAHQEKTDPSKVVKEVFETIKREGTLPQWILQSSIAFNLNFRLGFMPTTNDNTAIYMRGEEFEKDMIREFSRTIFRLSKEQPGLLIPGGVIFRELGR